jgi:DNA-binding transcriptional LysR family regulator
MKSFIPASPEKDVKGRAFAVSAPLESSAELAVSRRRARRSQRRRRRAAGGHATQNGSIGNAESVYAVDLQLGINHRHIIAAHFCGLRPMPEGDRRTGSLSAFELSSQGPLAVRELEGLLPRIEHLIMPTLFDPVREKSHFRIAGPDNACAVVIPRLCRQHANPRHQVQFEFLSWGSGMPELVEHGQVELMLHIDVAILPSHFQSERLYREGWICVVARDSRFGERLTLKHYLAASHIAVAPRAGVQTIPDKQLAAIGAKRESCIRMPYSGVGMQCLPGTDLVLTLTSGMAPMVKADRRLRLVEAPPELHGFHFLMAWHPRHNSDPRHVWLRQAIRSTTS